MGIPVMKQADFCANCAYWCGERKINGFFARAEIEDFNIKGQCQNLKGFYMQMCPYNGTCPNFERHPAIKK